MANNSKLIPKWDGAEYPHIKPGKYLVRIVGFQGPEFVRAFHRWSLRVECALIDEPVSVSAFFALGGDFKKPVIPGRLSRYYKVWKMANGGPPRHGEAMDWELLRDRCFVVRIEDSEDGSYSTVREFLRLDPMTFRTDA